MLQTHIAIIVPFISFIINIITISYIAAKDILKPILQSYLLFSITITLWVLAGWPFYFPFPDHLRVPFCKFSSILWFFSGFTFLNLIYTMLERKSDIILRGLFLIASFSVGITITTDLVLTGYKNYPWGWRFTEGPLFDIITLLTIIIPVIYSIVLFIGTAKQTPDSNKKKNYLFMAYGIFFSLATAALMQYVIPYLPGLEKSVRYTAPASSILSIFMFYAIIRYRFLSLEIQDIAIQLFSSIQEGIILLDNDGKIIQKNSAAGRILGIESGSQENINLEQIISSYSAKSDYTGYHTTMCRTGKIQDILITQSAITTTKGNIGKLAIINDISELMRLHDTVTESASRLTMISENVSDIIWLFNLSTMKFSYVSPSVHHIIGFTPEEFVQLSLDRHLPPQSFEYIMQLLADEIQHDQERDPARSRSLELQELRADGSYVEMEIKASFLRNPEGKPIEILGVSRDITDRKRLERDLKETLSELKVRNDSLEQELIMAQTIQHALLPEVPPTSNEFKIAYRYIPLEAVGGDYFNFQILEEGGLSIFVGDVSGHGVPAALFLALLKSESTKLLRKYAFDPAGYLENLNRELLGNMYSYFISAIYGVIRKNDADSTITLSISSAGHPQPVLYRKREKTTEYLHAKGKVIGVYKNLQFQSFSYNLFNGDRIFFYTDGLPEATNTKNELFGFDRLLETINEICPKFGDLDHAVDAIMESVHRFRETSPIKDDTVIIGIEIL